MLRASRLRQLQLYLSKHLLRPQAFHQTPQLHHPRVVGAGRVKLNYNAEGGTAQGLTFLNHFGGVNGIPGTANGGPA